jgi:hypothetical protein
MGGGAFSAYRKDKCTHNLGKPEGDLGIDERIILKWFLEKQGLKVN